MLPVRIARAHNKLAEADVEGAKSRLAAIESRQREIESLVESALKLEQQRFLLRHRLSWTTIRSSVSGTVLTQDLEQREGDGVKRGERIVDIARLDAWQARLLVSESDFPKIKLGQPVSLYVEAFPHTEYRVFRGTVRRKPSRHQAETDSPNGKPAKYPVVVSVDDPVVKDGGSVISLAYGMLARAKIVVERGSLVEVLWRKLLRKVGRIPQSGISLARKS